MSTNRFWSAGFAVATAVLVVFVLLLARQNLQLQQRLAEQDPMRNALEPGDVVPADTLMPTVGPTGSDRTVLLVFSAECPACQDTIPIWNELLIDRDDATILGVQLTRSESIVATDVGLDFSVRAMEPGAADWIHKIPMVPATILLDSEGVVEEVWFGILDEERMAEVTRALG